MADIIQAAGAFSKVEAVILETLADIPEMMDDAKRYIEIYRGCQDQLLEKSTFQLYLSVLKALNQIMQFFVDSPLNSIVQVMQATKNKKVLEGKRERK
ncbi:hypothetical protein SLS63_006725 [Diaporthe eres]|uniref:Uncharacterized protein n=1 Tax=Diaporthe eres TaxID=83184 RepID=A0ABR1P7C6_DIAER